MDAPQNPAGEYVAEDRDLPSRRQEFIARIEAAPAALADAVAGLSEGQLDEKYRNWTVRQIVHHMADSHVNAYVRFKWTLTEDRPTIKPYDQGRWADLEDARTGPVEEPIGLLIGLHAGWSRLLQSMTDAQFDRRYHHPETGRDVALGSALGLYAWHGDHHTAQIVWLRRDRGW